MAEYQRPLNISLSGPDGAGKDTAVLGVLDNLFQDYDKLKVVRLDRPPIFVWNDRENGIQTKKLYLPIFKFINFAHKIGDKNGNIRLVEFSNALNIVMQGRVVRRATEDKFNPNMFVSGRNYFTDPAAYSQFYAPEIARLKQEERLVLMKKISSFPDYDQIYFMQIDPGMALERIRERTNIERFKLTGERSWTHRHETREGLTLLVEEFRSLPHAVNNVFPETEVILVDASQSRVEVASDITKMIKTRLHVAK